MKQNGDLELLIKLDVHDTDDLDTDAIENKIYDALSVFGEIDILEVNYHRP